MLNNKPNPKHILNMNMVHPSIKFIVINKLIFMIILTATGRIC